jgi:hypothetical protein
MPHAFRRYPELWSSKRFDQVLMLLINWCLERVASMDDYGVHLEAKAPDNTEQDKMQDESDSDNDSKRRKIK